MIKQVLEDRKWNLNGEEVNWYSSLRKLESYKSVIRVEFINTSSSAGDWDGYFLQRLNSRIYLIPFSQENNWPHYGFTLYTGRVIASWSENCVVDRQEIYDLLQSEIGG